MASKIAEFAARQQEFFDRQSTAIDGIVGDVNELKDIIAQLQNSPGTITPEDQALLDTIDQRAQQLTQKLELLDSMTPPPTPAPAPAPAPGEESGNI